MLKAAIEQEVLEFLGNQNEVLEDGRKRLVRNGYLPERDIQTGIGPIEVQVPRVRDRSDVVEKLPFSRSGYQNICAVLYRWISYCVNSH